MKILVTGSEGFVSKELIKNLESRRDIEKIYGVNRTVGYSPESLGHKNDKLVKVYTCLENEEYVKSLFKFIKPDVVFHLSASQKNTPQAYEENTRATSYILKNTPTRTRFIYVSSSTVYGNQAQFVNRKCNERDTLKPTSLYGASKVADEGLIGVYDLAEKISALVIRSCAIVGVKATHGALQDIIRKTNEPGDSLELWGDSPGANKPYIHVSDIVGALIHFGLDKSAKGTYNICPSDEISIDRLADVVMENLGVNKKKTWVPSKNPSGDNLLVAMSDQSALADGWARKYNTSSEAIAAVVREWKTLNDRRD